MGGGGYCFDYRLVYINGLVDLFYEVKKNINKRFSAEKVKVTLRNISDEFSKKEIKDIERFCKKIGANYGELDLLRDRKTRKIYIVDFNKTPCAASLMQISRKGFVKMVERMSIAFINNVLSTVPSANKRT